MTQFLVDANHLSPLVTPGHPLRERIQRRFEAGDTFAIPAPVLNEFLFGIGTVPRATQNWLEWELIQSDFGYYEVDANDALIAAKLRLELRKYGWQLDIIDSFTAVIALNYDLTLLTTDKDFHALPDLKQENWRV